MAYLHFKWNFAFAKAKSTLIGVFAFVFNLLALTRNQNLFENGKEHFNWQNVIAFRSNLKCLIHTVIWPHYLLNNRTYSYYCYCYILHSKGWALKPDRCLIRWQVSTLDKRNLVFKGVSKIWELVNWPIIDIQN